MLTQLVPFGAANRRLGECVRGRFVYCQKFRVVVMGNAVEKNEERRNYRRISDAVAMQVYVCDKQDAANQPEIESTIELPDYPTHVVSLSPNGLKCYHTEPFNDGDKVMITLKLFPGKHCMDIMAKVVNSGEVGTRGKDDRFFAGLAFRNLTEETREILLAHIDGVARQSFGGAVKLVNN